MVFKLFQTDVLETETPFLPLKPMTVIYNVYFCCREINLKIHLPHFSRMLYMICLNVLNQSELSSYGDVLFFI